MDGTDTTPQTPSTTQYRADFQASERSEAENGGGLRQAFCRVPSGRNQRNASSELHHARLASFKDVPYEWRLPEVLLRTPDEGR
jgi:hypothetical protein